MLKCLELPKFRASPHNHWTGSSYRFRKNILIYLFFISVLFGLGCGEDEASSANSVVLNVATAANVQFAMKDIEVAFEEKYGVNINIIIGSSGKLTAQIVQGAPYDLLISANLKYPLHLYQEKLATTPPNIYALGSLVVWTWQDGLILDDTLGVLESAAVHKIAIANPKNAPYGEQALTAMEHFGRKEAVTSKLVYAESIAQTNLYVTTKNCEVGFTAKSVVLAPDMIGKGHWIEVPAAAYQPIEQGIVITKYGASKNQQTAQQFYDFMFADTAQQILKKYGYSLPSNQ